jgi:biopolymer transport protein ExbD
MARSENSAPLSEMNTTPLIDVLLVLLIMFVITIPVATHSVDVDVGLGPECLDCPMDPVINRVTIDTADTVMWNAVPVTAAQLARLLRETRSMPVEPELQFEPDASASYRVSAQTLATIQASGVTKFGFVGNERYRQFASR